MRIVAMSDWNESKPQDVLSAVESLAPDCFIFAGDGLPTISKKTVTDIRDATKLKKFLYVQGNHDLEIETWWGQLSGVECLNNKLVLVNGIPIVGYSGISNKSHFHSSVHGHWVFCREKNLEKDLYSLLEGMNGRAILVTHMPPHGVLDFRFGIGHLGSRALKRVVEKKVPLVHIFGHIHSFGGAKRKFKSTHCFNVASFEKETSARIVAIDITAKSLTGFHVQAVPSSSSSDLLLLYNISQAQTLDEIKRIRCVPSKEKKQSYFSVDTDKRMLRLRLPQIAQCMKEKVGGRISPNIVRELDELERSPFTRVSVRNFFLNECLPWPKGLTPRLMLDYYDSGVSPRKESSPTRLLEGAGSRSRNAARKFILEKICIETGRYCVDVDRLYKLPAVASSFFSAKWIPDSDNIIAASLVTEQGLVKFTKEKKIKTVERKVQKEARGSLVTLGKGYKSYFDFEDVINFSHVFFEAVGVGNKRKNFSTLSEITQLILGGDISYAPQFILDSELKKNLSITLHFLDCADKEFLHSLLTKCCVSEALLMRDASTAFGGSSKLSKKHFVLCRFDFESNEVCIQE
ncbi:metallophosphoesterase [Halodesulfovibrio sp.]|uniref:metallophosphoesterase family protein n=1 Tax=Halodesulfovibrio sp. TaxID=1912772 RepID=UPI0025EA7E26|nr:metallophosphoesterase [Halodesulfovibrio sp.]MCT4627230.1 metallophosphoesterase [Halodesulfovibrio sp.]